MKKVLIGGAVAAAVAAGLYYSNQGAGGGASMAELDYVPADTVFFASQLKPFPYKQYAQLLPSDMMSSGTDEELTQAIERAKAQGNVNAVFFFELLNQYESSVRDGSYTQTWGIGNDLRYLGYAIGLMPVMRAELEQPQNFINTLKKAADNAGVSYADESLNSQSYTRFTLALDDSSSVAIIAAIKDNWLTVTLDSEFNNQDDLALALATEKAQTSLNSSNRVNDYINKYQWDGSSISYVNFEALASAAVADKPSRLSSMLDAILTKMGQAQAMQALRTPGCKADIPAIAAKWPAIVSGTSNVKVSDSSADFDADIVIESTDKDILGALQTVRGFIPSHVTNKDDGLFSVGYGIDVGKLAPLANTVWSAFTQAEFTCEPLMMAQQQAKQSNPMAMAMATGMAAGVKGISISVQNVVMDFSGYTPQVSDIDALVTLSADDPTTLINTAKGLVPQLAQIEIPSDGTPISMNEIMPVPASGNVDAQLAINGQHITVYNGEKSTALAADMSSQAVDANGVLGMSLQFAPMMDIVLEAAASTGEELPPEIHSLAKQNMKLSLTTDITDNGVEMKSETNISKSK
ncbi:hypothetical protein ABMY44_05565 [Pseudoalteromonas sp. Cnat2-41]|uniref:hypothetical protein n=1 Tax=unclassified Pseudoalteromonas TaxID=194690 RepID=UPI001EF9040F|nr:MULTISPECIES: hypothetical protein [unclassified Pseudoalteromonas]MCF2861624.1 hypothetical protein [Pseudoalteromonas sp. CNAT2-18]MCG7557338.1 hypothetical protein [Pseudoalteromonas sp. CNAT2-18.1]